MDENRPSVIGGPTSVLDVLCGSMPRMGSNVSREPSDHRPSRNVSGSAVANCDLPIRDYFPKSRKRSDQKQLATGLAALGRRRAFPLGRTMSVIGGNSEVSALREFFAVRLEADFSPAICSLCITLGDLLNALLLPT